MKRTAVNKRLLAGCCAVTKMEPIDEDTINLPDPDLLARFANSEPCSLYSRFLKHWASHPAFMP